MHRRPVAKKARAYTPGSWQWVGEVINSGVPVLMGAKDAVATWRGAGGELPGSDYWQAMVEMQATAKESSPELRQLTSGALAISHVMSGGCWQVWQREAADQLILVSPALEGQNVHALLAAEGAAGRRASGIDITVDASDPQLVLLDSTRGYRESVDAGNVVALQLGSPAQAGYVVQLEVPIGHYEVYQGFVAQGAVLFVRLEQCRT